MPRGVYKRTGTKSERRASLTKPAQLAPPDVLNPFVTEMTQKNMTLQTENDQLKRRNETQAIEISDLKAQLGELALAHVRLLREG